MLVYLCSNSTPDFTYLVPVVPANSYRSFSAGSNGVSSHLTKWLPSADLHAFQAYYHTLFQDCKLRGSSVASV